MTNRLKLALSGTLILLSLFLVIFAAQYGAGLMTTTTELVMGIILLSYFLIPGLIIGFIGFYLYGSIIESK